MAASTPTRAAENSSRPDVEPTQRPLPVLLASVRVTAPRGWAVSSRPTRAEVAAAATTPDSAAESASATWAPSRSAGCAGATTTAADAALVAERRRRPAAVSSATDMAWPGRTVRRKDSTRHVLLPDAGTRGCPRAARKGVAAPARVAADEVDAKAPATVTEPAETAAVVDAESAAPLDRRPAAAAVALLTNSAAVRCADTTDELMVADAEPASVKEAVPRAMVASDAQATGTSDSYTAAKRVLLAAVSALASPPLMAAVATAAEEPEASTRAPSGSTMRSRRSTSSDEKARPEARPATAGRAADAGRVT
mmetsp:Transcript_16618/g.62937  ORF Transcript_16618/g.62937 Transcript_16618/m.62937 type:complete len:310 (-) Transcript_16618:241-1170(-)